MSIQVRVLEAAQTICRASGVWTFRPSAVVAALPDLNPGSVRTHVMSRCCVNAPSHHAHRWPYFRRVRRGVYEILPAWRRRAVPGTGGSPKARSRYPLPPTKEDARVIEVRESAGAYVAAIPGMSREFRGSLDETIERVRRFARESAQDPGSPLRLHLELGRESADPVIEAYMKDIDRSLVRQNLRRSFEERLMSLQGWANDMEAIRGAARATRKSPR